MGAGRHDPPRRSGNDVQPLASGAAVDGWVDAPAACDHCGVRRRRAITYVLWHESGTLAQVGTSCLADFTGTAEPLSRIGACSAHARALAELDRAAEAERQGVAYVPLADLLANVVAIAERAGFVGRSEASRKRQRPTYERAFEELAKGREIPRSAHERAAEIERWVLGELRNSPRKGAFERRLVATFDLGERVHPDRAALVAAAYRAWQRGRVRDDYVGEPGEGIEVVVEVRDVRRTERSSRWGEVFWHRLRDDVGHDLAWFAVGAPLEPGARVRLSGSVRRHDQFRGSRGDGA